MKALRKIICLILALVMSFGTAAAVYAESSSKVYIDDIKIGYGEEGKKALIAAGYKVDSNFNANQYGRGGNSDSSVWIGFHETTDPLEAITDVAVMNMNGDYTFSGWQEELTALQESINEMLSDFVAGIEEFRTNYKAGSPYAEKAYEYMNYFIDTDFTNKRIGDLLKNENTSMEDITNVFLKGNYQFVTVIKKCIALACTEWKQNDDGSYDTFVTRLNNNGYCVNEPDASMNHERELISTAISNLKPDIEEAEIKRDEYYNSYLLVKDNYKLALEEIPENCTDEELDTLQFEKYIADQCTELQYVNYLYYKNVINILENITIKPEIINKTTGEVVQERESFYDIVMKDSEKLTEYDLETIRLSMTTGQLGVLDAIGFASLLVYESSIKTGNLLDQFDEMLEVIEEEYDIDVVSVYYGVDLSVFDDAGNTALTKQAYNDMKNGEVSAFGQKIEEKTTGQKVGLVFAWILFAASAIVGTVSVALAVGGIQYLSSGVSTFLSQTPLMSGITMSSTSVAILSGIAIVCIALLVLCLITIVKSQQVKYVEQEDISYTKIPRCIVDTKTVKQAGVAEEKIYYTYTCAKRIDANENSSNTLDVYGDLNQYNKKDQWLCVYYTKNRDCGEPITSSVKLAESSDVPSGYVALHEFGSSASANLNRYNSGENKKAIYGYIKTTSFETGESGQTASVFNRETTMILTLAAFIVGAGATAVITYSGTKKKFKKA